MPSHMEVWFYTLPGGKTRWLHQMRTGTGVLCMTSSTNTTITKFTKWHSLVIQHAVGFPLLWRVLAQ
jgi:hypothetical protein